MRAKASSRRVKFVKELSPSEKSVIKQGSQIKTAINWVYNQISYQTHADSSSSLQRSSPPMGPITSETACWLMFKSPQMCLMWTDFPLCLLPLLIICPPAIPSQAAVTRQIGSDLQVEAERCRSDLSQSKRVMEFAGSIIGFAGFTACYTGEWSQVVWDVIPFIEILNLMDYSWQLHTDLNVCRFLCRCVFLRA